MNAQSDTFEQHGREAAIYALLLDEWAFGFALLYGLVCLTVW